MAVVWALLITQTQQFKENLFLVYSYGQGEYLVVKTTPTPDVVNNNNNRYAAPLQITSPKLINDRDDPCQVH